MVRTWCRHSRNDHSYTQIYTKGTFCFANDEAMKALHLPLVVQADTSFIINNKANLLITTASLVQANKAPNIEPDSSLFYRDTGSIQDRSI